MKHKRKILSAYTVARYCSDITDVMCGIEEIRGVINQRNEAHKPVPLYFYTRLSKLNKKLTKLNDMKSKKQSVFMQMHNGTRTGEGSFNVGLQELFYLAGNANRRKLVKAFPEFFGNEVPEFGITF
jgi:xanthine dehydrogenase molybdopterin-binding subunit B